MISYKREDGVELSGTLYLPADYDLTENGKVTYDFMGLSDRIQRQIQRWTEYTKNSNEFTYPYWGSPIYWLNRGYVVLDGASFPIVGEGDTGAK